MSDLQFVLRTPDKGYRGRQLWLPKSLVNTRSVKKGLEFPVMDAEGIRYIQLWSENETHLIIPREYISQESYGRMAFPIIDVGPRRYARVEFRSHITLDKQEPHKHLQRKAFRAMVGSDGGLLNLACVSGSTWLQLNRGGKGFRVRIKDAYERFHNLGKYPWNRLIPTFTRANRDGRIGLQQVLDIVYRGKRKVHILELQDGKKLRLTGDHEVLTNRGYMQIGDVACRNWKKFRVIVDGERTESIRKNKPRYKRLSWYPAHPYAQVQERKGRAPSCTLEEHRAVAECFLNAIQSVEEYRERFRTGNIKGLRFIDPKYYHVHHKNEDPRDNRPENLEILPRIEHLMGHQPGAEAFGLGVPTPSKIKSITLGGIEDVYDVVCDDPHHNFVANGIVVHNCGKGKTVLALHHIAQRKVPALVVVNNTTLINQWQERIAEYLDVPGGVGVAQGPPAGWEWEGCGIVIGMIHSLALRAEQLPSGFDRYFGGVYYDEVHHLSAPLFVKTAPLFFGERHGLTATTNREDGLESIYQYHIGQTYYRDLTQELKPKIYFQQCPIHVDLRDPGVQAEVLDKSGNLNIPKLRTYLGKSDECNQFIAEKLRKPIETGRKILVLSHSVDQLRNLHAMFADSGLCTGREKPADRIATLRSKQISFGTLQLVREALDEASLDTLFFLTPFGRGDIDEGGFNTLQQGMGRILRFQVNKREPIVVILDHIYVPKFHKMCTTLKRRLNQWPKEQGGPLEYTVIRPYQEEK